MAEINGTAGPDLLFGAAGDDLIAGGDQRDTLYGGAGDDLLQGGEGDDVLRGEAGDDRLEGGAGNDDLTSTDQGSDTLSGGEGNDVLYASRTRTGDSSAPTSVLPLITAPESSQSISVSGFLPVPTLSVGQNAALAWNGELGVSFDAAAGAVSLVRYDVRSGGGLVSWSIAAPPTAAGFRLPDLSRLPDGGLIAGELDVGVSLASVEGFDYATLNSEQLSRFSWQAYATDVARARYAPTAP